MTKHIPVGGITIFPATYKVLKKVIQGKKSTVTGLQSMEPGTVRSTNASNHNNRNRNYRKNRKHITEGISKIDADQCLPSTNTEEACWDVECTDFHDTHKQREKSAILREKYPLYHSLNCHNFAISNNNNIKK